MLSENRHQQILDMLEDKRFLTVQQLCVSLYASGATIRRDLAAMEKKGLITRVRGGALLGGDGQEKPFLLRESQNRDKKLTICALARRFVTDGMSLTLDSSSTIALLVSLLHDVRGLSVVTNGLRTVNALTNYTDARILCTGGTLQDTSSMWGQAALDAISRYYTDCMIFSCKGVSIEQGITDSCEEDAQIKRCMLKNTRKKILLCDSSKFSKTFLCRIGALTEMDVLITDKAPDADFLNAAPCEVLYP